MNIPDEVFTDPEGLPLTVDIVPVKGEVPRFMEIIPHNNTILGYAYFDDAGEYKFTIRATDDNDQTVEQIVKIKIVRCHFKCERCFGEAAYECETCLPGFNLHDNYCLDTCPTTFYADSLVCHSCPTECNTCEGPDSTTQCPDCGDGFYVHGNGCYESCPDGFYNNPLSLTCQPCDSKCLTCFGPTERECTSCDIADGFFLGGTECREASCPDSYYFDFTSLDCIGKFTYIILL